MPHDPIADIRERFRRSQAPRCGECSLPAGHTGPHKYRRDFTATDVGHLLTALDRERERVAELEAQLAQDTPVRESSRGRSTDGGLLEGTETSCTTIISAPGKDLGCDHCRRSFHRVWWPSRLLHTPEEWTCAWCSATWALSLRRTPRGVTINAEALTPREE